MYGLVFEFSFLFFFSFVCVYASVCCHETSSSQHCEISFSDVDGMGKEGGMGTNEGRLRVVDEDVFILLYTSQESPSICIVGIPNIFIHIYVVYRHNKLKVVFVQSYCF